MLTNVLTTIIELLGFALLVTGAALFVGQWSTPGGFVTAGVLALGVSVVIVRPWKKAS